MKTKIKKPDNYEALSPEEKLKFFENFEYEDNADTIQKLKDSVSNANSQAAEWKKKHNALLSEEEKAKLERDEELSNLREELEQVKKREKTADYTAKYISLGYDSELAASTAEALSKGDTVTVFANHATFNKSLEEKITAGLMKDTPSPKTGENGAVTKEQFNNMNYTEKAKLYSENKELYTQLQGE